MDKLPEIYWYVFWVGFVIIAFGGMMIGGILAHRARLRELDILRSYAEKGIEPPPAMLEALAGPDRQHQAAAKAEGRQAGVSAGVHLGQFVGQLFAAGLTGGLAWWAAEGRAPEWLFYGAVIVTIACVAGAVARLVAVIATREK
jgi:hypothetical protein